MPKFKPKVAPEQMSILKKLEKLQHDELFRAELSPLLVKAVKERWSVEKIYKECSSFIAAKAVMVALLEDDAGKAMTAVKEVLDRGIGKPVEKREIRATYQNLSDNELDNLLTSALGEVTLDDASEDSKH